MCPADVPQQNSSALLVTTERWHVVFPEARPGAATARQNATGSRKPTIAVLGAGVAGLVAAYELERLGYEVVVWEADDRVGGRVYTWRFEQSAGDPVELGAMRIPSDHELTLRYVDAVGLGHRLRPFRSILSESGNHLRIDGELVRVRDAPHTLVEKMERVYGSGSFHRESLLFVGWLATMVQALAPRELRELGAADIGKLLRAADERDMTPFVRHGSADLKAGFAACPELRTMCSSRLESFLDDILLESGDELLELVGGMDQLIDGITREINGPIRTGHEVASVHLGRGGAAVRVCSPRGDEVHTYPFVLCTLPFTVLRGVTLRGIDSDKQRAIDTLDYGSATKVGLLCREAFWTEDGVRGGGSAPGGLSRQTYYPRAGDRARALLGSYAIAEDADVLGELPEAVRHKAVLDELAELHPRLGEPGAVLDAASIAWGQRKWNKGCAARRWGATADERARDVTRTRRPCGRLFFAGEHCSATPAWINAAIESALDAVREIDALARELGDDRMSMEGTA